MERPARMLVIVSGAPGAGKTSLAVPLATELGYSLVYKDRIKETLHDAFGAPAPDLAWSRRLGAAAMELLWALAADAPHVVIEANFRPHHAYELTKLAGLAGCAAAAVEVHCACPADVALRRYNERGPTRHPVHVQTSLPAEAMAEYDGPAGVGQLITVDTTGPVDIPGLAATVRDRLYGEAWHSLSGTSSPATEKGWRGYGKAPDATTPSWPRSSSRCRYPTGPPSSAPSSRRTRSTWSRRRTASRAG